MNFINIALTKRNQAQKKTYYMGTGKVLFLHLWAGYISVFTL